MEMPMPRSDVVNPAPERIGRENVVYSGTARRHHVRPTVGSLSVKATLRGEATWVASGDRFRVSEDHWLLLGDGEEYTLTIDSDRPVTTFCVFFRRGFVDDALLAARTPPERLLDDPEPRSVPVVSGMRRYSDVMGALVRRIARVHRRQTLESAPVSWEEVFLAAGEALAEDLLREERAALALPAAKPSTRDELNRRIRRGIDFMLSNLERPIRIDEVAREACLSTFHFHRSFRTVVGESPHQFLVEQRIRRAEALLSDSGLPIAMIGQLVGFETASSFASAFVARRGRTPSSFRRESRPSS